MNQLNPAFMTACASLVVAAMSFVSVWLSNRNSAKVQVALEELKIKLAREDLKAEHRYKDVEAKMESLQRSVRVIQAVRDALYFTLTTSDGGMTTKAAIAKLRQVREEIFESYKEEHPLLHEDDRLAFHKAKGLAVAAEQYAESEMKGLKYTSDMTLKTQTEMQRIRDELADIQQRLRDSHSARLVEMIQ